MEDNLVYAGFVAVPLGELVGIYLYFTKCQPHKATGQRWRKLMLGNLLVLLFAASLAALLGETYFRFFYDTTDSFALTKTSRRWFRWHVHENNMGVRDNQDYSPERTPDRTRITFVGDSFTVGHGICDVEARFGNRIRRMHPDWEIHVVGYLGYDSGKELAMLQRTVGNYEIDRVVLVYCLNDIDDVNPQWTESIAKTEVDKCYKKVNTNWAIEHSYLINTLYYRMLIFTLPGIGDYFRFDHDAYFGPPWTAQALRLKKMRDLVRGQGGKLYVVTFPYLHLLGPHYDFRDVHKKLDEYWQSIGVPNLDLLPVFEPYPARRLMVNAHDAHPNEFANALAADAISEFLEQQIRCEDTIKPVAAQATVEGPSLRSIQAATPHAK
jgi:hypothetical protein